jgi:hypothetical protein
VAFDASGNLVASAFALGTPTQAGLSWNVTAGTCTSDSAGGKLTVNGSSQIICAADSGSGGSGSVTQIEALSPLTGGTITSTGTIGIQDAAANSTTKGAATFTTEFLASAGVIRLNYAGGQMASGSQPGYLSAAHWTLFNSKQDVLTWGAGLTASGTTVSVASTEPGFLTNGEGLDLVCGNGTAGKAQVMASGDVQYCDGATVPALRKGGLVQPGLSWAVTLSTCTSDVNGGKLTLNGSNQIICAPDVQSTPGNAQADGVTKGIVTFLPGEMVCVNGSCSLPTLLAGKTLPNSTTLTVKDSLFTLQNATDASKQARFDLSAIPTVTTVLYALPPASDTLVGANAVINLSGKTLVSPIFVGTPSGLVKAHVGLGNVDNTSNATERVAAALLQHKTLDPTNTITLTTNKWLLQDPIDLTKEAQWDLSGITPGTRRIYALPNASDTLMCLTCAQTPVANKIISGSNNMITNISLSTGVTGLLPSANLAPTGVTAGTYTGVTLTVNAQGQILAASSGAGATGISGASASGVLYALTASTATSTPALTNGQLVIGSTGNAPAVGTLTGTANQITVALGAGTITLAIPSSPTLPGITTGTFSGNLTGNVTGNVTGTLIGNASTATALAADPSDCTGNQFATGIAPSGNLTCTQPSFANLSGAAIAAQLPNPGISAGGKVQAKDCAGTGHVLSINTDSTVTCSADLFAALPSGCASNTFAISIATNGNLTCAQPSFTNLTGAATSAQLPLPTTGLGGKVQAKDCTGIGHILAINTDSTVTCSADAGASGGLGDPGANGYVVRTASGTTIARTLTGTAGNLSITNPTGAAGNSVFDLVDTVTAGVCTNCNLTYDTKGRITAAANGGGAAGLADPGGPGYVVRTTSGVTVPRTLTGTAAISITNPTGVAGNSVFDLVDTITPGSCTNCNLTYDAKGRVTIAANGSSGGAGNVLITGTPTAGQAAEWTSATAIQGVGVSGTGLYAKTTGATFANGTFGVATVTTINKLAITPPTTSATLTIANGKTFQASNTLTLTGIDGSSVALGSGGTVLYDTLVLTTTAPLTGGHAATSNWTLGCATCVTSGASLPANQLVFGAGSQGLAAGDLTGDVTTSGGKTTTLATVNSTSGTFTNATVTVDGKGRITAASSGSSTPITIVGTPAAGQTAEWTGAASLQAVGVSGTGLYVKGTAPSLSNALLTTPTITVLDTAFTLRDDGDPTRQGLFQLGTLTPGTTRVLSWPDFSGTIATLAGVETFSNKTLANAGFTTALTGPLLIGGTGTGSSLTLQSTTGVGATDSILFKVGNNGAITAGTITTAGNLGLGVVPSTKLHLLGASAEVRHTGSTTQQTLCYKLFDNNVTEEGSLCYAGAAAAGSRFLTLASTATDGVRLTNINDVALTLGTNNTTRMSLSSAMLNVGIAGGANPALRVDYSAGSAATGIGITAQAAGTAPILAALSSGTNEDLAIDAKGSGSLLLHKVSTGNVYLGGTAPHTLGMARNTTAATAGQLWTVTGGGATSGSTDKDAGGIVLQTGPSTGTGKGLIRIQGTTTATATGTSDNVQIDKVIYGHQKRLANNTITSVLSMTIANNTSVSVVIEYGVEVKDGANVQANEGGRIICQATNVAGSVVVNGTGCTKVGNTALISNFPTSTLAVDWSMSAANPSVISINANSSLTPSTGFPLANFPLIVNLGSQAMAVVP